MLFFLRWSRIFLWKCQGTLTSLPCIRWAWKRWFKIRLLPCLYLFRDGFFRRHGTFFPGTDRHQLLRCTLRKHWTGGVSCWKVLATCSITCIIVYIVLLRNWSSWQIQTIQILLLSWRSSWPCSWTCSWLRNCKGRFLSALHMNPLNMTIPVPWSSQVVVVVVINAMSSKSRKEYMKR